MKIVISNIVTLNVGDAAILKGMIAVLRRAFGDDVEIVVFDKAADAARRYYPWASFRQAMFSRRSVSGWRRAVHDRGWSHRIWRFDAWRFRTAASRLGRVRPVARLLVDADEAADIEAYRSADVVISSGGTYLVENYGLEPAMLDYELTLALGRPLVFFTQSLGPFRKEEHRRRLGAVFRSALALFVRDDPSAAHLLELGVTEDRVVRCADAAFALARPRLWARPAEHGAPRVAFSVRGWRHFSTVDPEVGERRYFDAVAALAGRLVCEHAAEVTFVSTCQGMPEYWTDDSETARRVVERLAPDVAKRVRVDGRVRGPEEMIDTYAAFDLVVATRMHAAILALCAGTPVLPIAYEFKTKELFERMGLGEWVTDIEEISPDTFPDLGEACLARLAELRDVIGREVPRLRDSAFLPAAVLRERARPVLREPDSGTRK